MGANIVRISYLSHDTIALYFA